MFTPSHHPSVQELWTLICSFCRFEESVCYPGKIRLIFAFNMQLWLLMRHFLQVDSTIITGVWGWWDVRRISNTYFYPHLWWKWNVLSSHRKCSFSHEILEDDELQSRGRPFGHVSPIHWGYGDEGLWWLGYSERIRHCSRERSLEKRDKPGLLDREEWKMPKTGRSNKTVSINKSVLSVAHSQEFVSPGKTVMLSPAQEGVCQS